MSRRSNNSSPPPLCLPCLDLSLVCMSACGAGAVGGAALYLCMFVAHHSPSLTHVVLPRHCLMRSMAACTSGCSPPSIACCSQKQETKKRQRQKKNQRSISTRQWLNQAEEEGARGGLLQPAQVQTKSATVPLCCGSTAGCHRPRGDSPGRACRQCLQSQSCTAVARAPARTLVAVDAHTHTHTHTQTHTDTHTDTHRHTDTQTHTPGQGRGVGGEENGKEG